MANARERTENLAECGQEFCAPGEGGTPVAHTDCLGFGLPGGTYTTLAEIVFDDAYYAEHPMVQECSVIHENTHAEACEAIETYDQYLNFGWSPRTESAAYGNETSCLLNQLTRLAQDCGDGDD